MSVLDVRDLQTHFFTDAGVVKAVDGVSLSLDEGEVLGLVGESGSGKSVTGFSILRLVDRPGRVVGGQINFRGQNLADLSDREMRGLRGKKIAMIFQDPMMTLNPVLSIETQMVEAVRTHERISHAAANDRAIKTLAKVGIPSPTERLEAYPHQFSGGMRQRVAIAIALINGPDLIVADEPTTALDVTIQSQILAEVQELARETGTALIWITHDLAVVAGLADKISVMYAGRIVETGPTDEVLAAPGHPYTAGLLGSIPGHGRRGERLTQIPGMAPNMARLPEGCAFAPRCTHASDACLVQAPAITNAGPGRALRCLHPLLSAETTT
ncbi:ABC transporter ATP-binding protein [Rhodobacteraceae bacterium N5(2021)]|uniref:ABC transporter ATP-binding protein n=1 Tax=Gymnodinialimonas phycosphaerae TaxID=2841589 RepID=A0A975TT16_9RHOB|nr:ABC transporter ATP-binding protein [Gymnodinialimonas phycosphaerae]MBY4893557.1 ABC transporter ATP-binding protein [Gymnodinialimonas phycosphaerae]